MKKLVPSMVYDDIYRVPYIKLYGDGIRCLLFDLENTCVGYREMVPNEKLKKLFADLKKMDFRVIIFSNAPKKRLLPFMELDVICHYFSKKPFPRNFKKIMREYGLDKSEVCIIGDQLFTDILGGNLVGITSCLVKPISDEDFIFTKVSRFFEKIAFSRMKKKGEL